MSAEPVIYPPIFTPRDMRRYSAIELADLLNRIYYHGIQQEKLLVKALTEDIEV